MKLSKPRSSWITYTRDKTSFGTIKSPLPSLRKIILLPAMRIKIIAVVRRRRKRPRARAIKSTSLRRISSETSISIYFGGNAPRAGCTYLRRYYWRSSGLRLLAERSRGNYSSLSLKASASARLYLSFMRFFIQSTLKRRCLYFFSSSLLAEQWNLSV